ncbi:DUF6587 family protein [Cupriavidus plantarum]|nr:DUF6587 family protein [Cupriavidus plantarum]NYI02175.1 hypothetical protein [Cupriavidus plantarum]
MTLYHAFETLVVPLIVLACALSVAARYLPRTRERVKASLAGMLGGAMAPGWRGWIARRLSPAAAAGCATGCDTNSGCGTCGSNTSASAPPPSATGGNEQVIRFMRRP